MSWKGFGKRIEQAILDRQSQIGQRLTLGGIGVAVAKRERRDKPYGTSTVSAWIDETNEPTLATFEALAAELGTTPSWLAFAETHEVRVYRETPRDEPTAPAASQAPPKRRRGRSA